MKAMMGVLFLLLATASGFAQTPKTTPSLTEKQWKPLLQALKNEDWTKAADQAGKYLQEGKQEDSEHSLARLRYLFMFASAAKVAEGKMTYPELKVALKDLEGKEVFTPYVAMDVACPRFNAICFKANNDNYDLSLTSSNATATYIYLFLYAKLSAKPESQSKQKLGAVLGTLETIQFNPNESNIWILRVFIEKATLVFPE